LLLYQYGPQREEKLVYGYPWQADVYATGAWIESNTPVESRIGAYNAGIPAYLWNRTVINLDGVVNRDAYHALKNCATRDYIREEQIDYVADSAGQLFLTDCALSVERDLTEIAVVGGILPVHILKPKDTP
jgi:hypothetical protein